MMTVLCGVLGMLLGISLALAAAFFLQPRYDEALVGNRALSISQMASQIAMSLSMRRNDEGTQTIARTPVGNLVSSGFLKGLPVNPFLGRGGRPFQILYASDVVRSDLAGDVVFGDLGFGNEQMQVCRWLNRQGGGGSAIPQMDRADGTSVRPMILKPSGCFQVHADGIYGQAEPGDYVAYSLL